MVSLLMLCWRLIGGRFDDFKRLRRRPERFLVALLRGGTGFAVDAQHRVAVGRRIGVKRLVHARLAHCVAKIGVKQRRAAGASRQQRGARSGGEHTGKAGGKKCVGHDETPYLTSMPPVALAGTMLAGTVRGSAGMSSWPEPSS